MWLTHLGTLIEKHRVFLVDTVGDLNKSSPKKVIAKRADVVSMARRGARRLEHQHGRGPGTFLWWVDGPRYGMLRHDRVDRLVVLGPAAVFSRVGPSWIARAV